jgi:hypothetical protein
MRRDKHLRPTPDQAHRDIPALRFWNNIDRDEFEWALGGNDKYASFLRALYDPHYSRCSFPTLLRKFNISLHEAQMLYTDHMRLWGLLQMSNHLPEIMEDVAEDALSHIQACPRCDGEKVVESTHSQEKVTKPCPECNGSDKVRLIGDSHARDLVFECMKLIRQRQGPLVTIQQQNIGANGGLDSRLEDLLKAGQAIALGPPRIANDPVEAADHAFDGDNELGQIHII